MPGQASFAPLVKLASSTHSVVTLLSMWSAGRRN